MAIFLTIVLALQRCNVVEKRFRQKHINSLQLFLPESSVALCDSSCKSLLTSSPQRPQCSMTMGTNLNDGVPGSLS